MRYLLDSNAIVALVMNLDEALTRRAGACYEGEIVTSAIAYAEVAHGAMRRLPPDPVMLQAFVEEVPVLPFDAEAALAYAALPLRRGGYDRLIAAHALSRGLTMVTHNLRDFGDVPGLAVENWMTELYRA